MPRPPLGTKCAPCEEKGHTCPAQMYVTADVPGENATTEVPMCLDCGDDQPCSYTRVNASPKSEEQLSEAIFDAPRTSVRLCESKGCTKRAAPDGSYCSTAHYDLLVHERKSRKALKSRVTVNEPEETLITAKKMAPKQKDIDMTTPAPGIELDPIPLIAKTESQTRHPLITALVEMIPTGGHWPESKRLKWKEAANSVFNLVFEDEG